MTSSKHSVRLYSLDAFRGITIAGMLLVNTSSLSPVSHPWLVHAYWNGCTPADWVFPFFLFITGVAMAFSLAKYGQDLRPTRALYWRLLRRGLLLFTLGLIVSGFWSPEWTAIRFTGVLQRISLAYLATALITLNLPRKTQWCVTALLLLGYWAAYVAFPIPEPVYQPEDLARPEIGTFGIMSRFGMMTTIAIVLMGYFTGAWLQTEVVIKKLRTSRQSSTLVLFGLSSLLLGQLWSLWLPINKKLWTGSYALFTVGLALLLLAAFYELIEVRGKKQWSSSLQVLGLNSIVVYTASELVVDFLERNRVGVGSHASSTYTWLSEHLFGKWTGSATASVSLAFITLLFWWFVAYCLYRQRWLIRV